MVVESIMNPLNAEKHPLRMFFVGALYTSIAFLLSIWIFGEYSSLVMVFLTVLACAPLMYNTIKTFSQVLRIVMRRNYDTDFRHDLYPHIFYIGHSFLKPEQSDSPHTEQAFRFLLQTFFP